MGVDPGVAPALVVLGSDLAVPITDQKEFAPHKGKKDKLSMARFEKIATWILDRVIAHKPNLVVLEGYAFGNSKTLVTLVSIGAVVRYLLFSNGFPYIEVAPTQLKKFCGSSGLAKKDEIRLEAFKKWGFEHPSNDVVDAYVLAQVGMYLLDKNQPKINSHEAAVLGKIRQENQCNQLQNCV